MRKLIFMCLLGTLLASCSLLPVHKLEIEQGNVITPDQINRLHPGMTEHQVKEIMGTPVLINLLANSELSYIYTFQIGSKPRTEKRVSLLFRHGILQVIQREGI